MSQKEKLKGNNQKVVHICIIIAIIIVILAIAGIIILRYQVEGETNLPFSLKNLIIVSSAEGYDKENPVAKWDLTIDQTNDVYLSIEKNPNYKKSETIKNVTIENIHVEDTQNAINMAIYRPADSGLYKKEDTYKVEGSLNYKGSKETNLNSLEIANQGGVVLFRMANQNVASYQSDEESEIIHDGTLFVKTETSLESMQATLCFDMIIETGSGIKYKATIREKIPVGNIIGEGTCTFEKTDFSDLVFKRV